MGRRMMTRDGRGRDSGGRDLACWSAAAAGFLLGFLVVLFPAVLSDRDAARVVAEASERVEASQDSVEVANRLVARSERDSEATRKELEELRVKLDHREQERDDLSDWLAEYEKLLEDLQRARQRMSEVEKRLEVLQQEVEYLGSLSPQETRRQRDELQRMYDLERKQVDELSAKEGMFGQRSDSLTRVNEKIYDLQSEINAVEGSLAPHRTLLARHAAAESVHSEAAEWLEVARRNRERVRGSLLFAALLGTGVGALLSVLFGHVARRFLVTLPA